MAKNSLDDYDTTAAGNTDVAGVGISGTDTAKNIRPMGQQIMAALARFVKGTDPVADTVVSHDTTDTTKTFRFVAENIPTSTQRDIDVENLSRIGAPRETIYTASGTHTFATTTRYFQIEAVGAGGGGGGVDGQGSGTLGGAPGGGSGFSGISQIFERGAIASGTVTIGALGAGGAAGANNGADGGNTTWADGTNSLNFGGGKGGTGVTASAVGSWGDDTALASSSGVLGNSDRGWPGEKVYDPTFSRARSGRGGNSAWGSGGAGRFENTASGQAGQNASGYGAGGSGAVVNGVNTNFAGGDGAPGYLIVREW